MTAPRIRTPDQRLRVFVSSTLGELAEERTAVRRAIEQLRLSPVMFELGARPHPPRELYRAYLDQSDVFVGIYGASYGWIAPGEEISGLEDEYRLAGDRPRLMYLKEPAPDREPRLTALLAQLQDDDHSTYRPFSTTEELEELVLNDLSLLLSERFAEASPDPAPRADVPVPLTETIGRIDDTDAVVAALRGGARLVTLTGPGGVGKTRLALEVAARLQGDFPGGVQFVGLAAITDPSLVVWELIDRLGARVEGSATPVQALVDRLRGPATLLVLDNLEQVAESGAELAELLSRAPTLHVLATSRQALRVAGEHEHVVTPLAPDEAVALFLARARDVTPGYEPTEQDRDALGVLSRRLDGLPLAIELAAARSRLLPPVELLGRLDDRFSVLAAPAGDRPERQRTLQATLDWSHDLLDDDERTLFAWLATFAGGWALDAAEGVCGPSGVDVLDGLASLLDKSLVVAEPDERGSPRFRMFETVRAYARQQLDERPDAEAARRAHLDWFCALGEEAQPFLCGPHQAEWMARVEPERANLRAAVATGMALGEHLRVVDLTWDVVVHYFVRDAVHEPYGWLCDVRAASPDLDRVGQAKLRTLHALLATFHGETEGARAAFEWSLDVFRAHEELGLEEAVALKELAFLRYAEDADPAGAIADLEEADRRFEQLHHDWGQSLVQIMIGTLLAAEGDLEPAARHLELALEHAERIANDQLLAQGLSHLALVCCRQGRFDEAEQVVARAAETVRRGRFGTDAAACLDALAAILLARDDRATAGQALAAAAEARRHIGATLWPTLEAYVQSLAAAATPAPPEEGADAGGDVFAALDRTLLTVVGSAV